LDCCRVGGSRRKGKDQEEEEGAESLTEVFPRLLSNSRKFERRIGEDPPRVLKPYIDRFLLMAWNNTVFKLVLRIKNYLNTKIK
jgi:hypothetical protein